MDSARFIGRVGGLAITLGIGVAVAQGVPAASADASPDHSSPGQAQKKHPGPPKPSGLKARTAPAKAVSAAPAVARPGKRIPGVAGGDPDGTPGAPAVWALAAAARRELGHDAQARTSAAPTKSAGAAEAATADISPNDGFWLNGTGSRILTSTVDGTGDTGYMTRLAVMDTESDAQIGDTVTVQGAPSGVPVLSTDGSHVLVTVAGSDSSVGAITRVVVIATATGDQTGTTRLVVGDAGSVTPLLLTADGTRALITTTGYDPLDAARATTWLAVVDVTAGSQTGAAVKVAGLPTPGSPQLTADGTRAVLTTFVDDWEAHRTSVRVAVFNTDAGTQVGTTLSLTGQPVGTKLVGTSAVISTSAGIEATVNTIDGTFRTDITGPPFGLDLQGFFYTPLGQFVGTAYLLASFAFGIVVLPLIAIYDTVAEALGLPTFTEWQLSQIKSV